LSREFKTTENVRVWTKGENRDYMVHFERFFVQHGIVKDIPVQQRISMKSLDTLLRRELLEKGISTPYIYGVYSVQEDSFVMKSFYDDAYRSQFKTTNNFRYNISLFPSSNELIAKLCVDFPAKRSFLWSGLWINLIGTFLFTGIVIFCFFYTIKVIVEQKKISEMKSDFLNNMTHEFKTPIATIKLAIDAIENVNVKNDLKKRSQYLNMIPS
jgi:two-component system phosphate regulon sensor histidine kinase PhoR